MLKDLNKIIHRIKKINSGKALSHPEEIARTTLLKYTTYRLPSAVNQDRLIALRMWVRISKRIFSSLKDIHKISENKSAILSPGINRKDDIIKHIEIQSKEEIGSYINKDFLRPKCHEFLKGLIVVRLLFFALYILRKGSFDSDRQHLSLQVIHAGEITFLLDYLRENKIDIVYDFAGFHIDSNLLSIILDENKIQVYKSPSPGALETHYRHMICHTICYSNPYQLEELSKFEDSMIYQHKLKWRPQMSHLYLAEYLMEKEIPENAKLKIGFYSHGEWIRRVLGHSDVGRGTLETEEFILKQLGRFLINHPNYQLKIYPHPLEKRDENLEVTYKHYSKMLGHKNFELAGPEIKTTSDFRAIDVALVAASTLIYERLYCGFKIYVGMRKENQLFHAESSLNNICFDSYESLENLILESQMLSNEMYFDQKNLAGYHHQSFD